VDQDTGIKASSDPENVALKDIVSSSESIAIVIRSIFEAIRNSIASKRRESSLPNIHQVTSPSSSASPHKHISISNKSKTARVINKALDKPGSDPSSVSLALSCLVGLHNQVHDQDQGPQDVFVKVMESYLRLLLTLSHAAEFNIAETATRLVMAIIKEPPSWSSYRTNEQSEISIEAEMIFFSLNLNDLSSYRSQMVRSYMEGLLDPSSDSKIILEAQQILLHDDNRILRLMHSWIESPQLHPRSLILLALTSILHVSSAATSCLSILTSLSTATIISHFLAINCIPVYDHDDSSSGESLAACFDLEYARYCLKILSNLAMTDCTVIDMVTGKQSPIKKHVLHMKVATASHEERDFHQVAQQDEILGFYYNLIVS
jgi:hypothetical protein